MTTDAVREHLRHTYGSVPVGGKGFGRPMTTCSLPDCRGMCCYDGVYVDAATEVAIVALAEARRSDFAAMGLDLPEAVVVNGEGNARKTAIRRWDGGATVRDYPEAFSPTCCVFHLDDGRCGLQMLALRDGQHPWAYKPHPCWLFPISIKRGFITIHDDSNNPSGNQAYNDFVVSTRCGSTCADGRPAIEVFAAELRYLGEILGRDLIAEVNAQVAP